MSAFLFAIRPGFDEADPLGCGVAFSASEEARSAVRMLRPLMRALPSWSDSPSRAAMISSHSFTLARVVAINSSSNSGDISSSRANIH